MRVPVVPPLSLTPAARSALATLVGPNPMYSSTRASDSPEPYSRIASPVCSSSSPCRRMLTPASWSNFSTLDLLRW